MSEVDIMKFSMNEGLAKELIGLTNIQVDSEQSTTARAQLILKYCHDLFSHNGNKKPSSFDPKTIVLEASQGDSFRCVEYSFLAVWLLEAYGISARTIGLKTEDVETNTYGAGHVVMEYWDDQLNKWVMCDVQTGLIPVEDDVLLSTYEFRSCLYGEGRAQYIRVGKPGYVEQVAMDDNTSYEDWIKPYLFFIDMQVEMKEKYTGSDLRDGRIVTLVPVGVTPPKMFQGLFAMNAQYINDPELLYQNPA